MLQCVAPALVLPRARRPPSSRSPHSSPTLAGTAGLTGAQFHPDGVIFGLGTGSGVVRIWDVKEQSNVATFEGHSGALRAMAFSENGYYMATAAEDATVKLWDLRKLKAFHTIDFDAGHDINALAFDHSGSYLAVGGSDIR